MTEEEFEREMETIRHSAALPNAAAIGETGIDTLKGGDLTRQQEALMRHISISEDTCRPHHHQATQTAWKHHPPALDMARIPW